MTGAEPQPDAPAPPPPDPAGPGSANPPADKAGLPIGTIASSPAPIPAPPTWPIALAVWCLADAAYELADFMLNLLPNPKLWIGLLTGSATVGGLDKIFRMELALGALMPLLAVLLLLCGAAIFLRRRWALWALGAWALMNLLQLLGWIVLSVLQLRSMPLLYFTWALVSYAPYQFLLSGAVLLFLCRGNSRRQFRVWSDNCLPVPRPIWPIVVGWLSMFLAIRSLNSLIRELGLSAVSYYLAKTGYPGGIGQQWPTWLVVLQLVGILPFLAMTALVFPAIGLLKRRPNAARLHVIGAVFVLASLLVGPIVDALSHHYTSGGDPRVLMYGNVFLRTTYPMFLLFWFLRPAIRREVTQWRRPGAPAIIPAGSERGS